MQEPHLLPVLLNTKQAAKYLGLSNHGTLNVWRATKRYPIPYIKIGRLVRYRLSDLDAFLVKHVINITNIEQL